MLSLSEGMKLAIIGTHSTGKTTLIAELAKTLIAEGKKVIVVPEMARLCPLPINEGTSAAAQKWILEKQISEENAIRDSKAIIICDRATIDNFVYFFRHNNRLDQRDNLAAWEALAVQHASTYDVLFKTQKLPIPAEIDGARQADDEAFREEIDEILTKLLDKHAIPRILLPATTNYATHVAFITSHLKSSS